MKKSIISFLMVMLLLGATSITFADADWKDINEDSMNKTQLISFIYP